MLVTLDAKGRFTLPKKLRTSIGLVAGDRLVFSKLVDGTVIVHVKKWRSQCHGGLSVKPDQSLS
ncbi:AbrB/MazE/SpoVT family DNA-binding domain-containing protein [Massilia eburnea]|uniref:AbrB/MazE/SpoVT family DNA-binding domain-containing protein n=1 Tax=Massilia eburnea TaxID=1776165 RepID=UPI003D6B575B